MEPQVETPSPRKVVEGETFSAGSSERAGWDLLLAQRVIKGNPRFLSVESLLTPSPQKPKLNCGYSAIFPFQPLPRMHSNSFLILLGLKSTHYSYVQTGSILPHFIDSKSHIFSPHPCNWNES